MKKIKKGRTANKTRKAKAPETSAPRQSSAGKARAEGLRLFRVAGCPTREHFLAVFGKNGDRLTWEQRAKVAGLPSAEKAAAHFQTLLTKAAK